MCDMHEWYIRLWHKYIFFFVSMYSWHKYMSKEPTNRSHPIHTMMSQVHVCITHFSCQTCMRNDVWHEKWLKHKWVIHKCTCDINVCSHPIHTFMSQIHLSITHLSITHFSCQSSFCTWACVCVCVRSDVRHQCLYISFYVTYHHTPDAWMLMHVTHQNANVCGWQ